MCPVDPGYTLVAIPLITASFPPTGEPELALRFAFVGTYFNGAAIEASLVTFVECTIVHITFLSSHALLLNLSTSI